MFNNKDDITNFLSLWTSDDHCDAHIHLLPQTIHDRYHDMDEVYKEQSIESHSVFAKEHEIKRAIIMPYNDPYMFCISDHDQRPDIEQVNRELVLLTKLANEQNNGCKYYFAADVDVKASLANNVSAIEYAAAHGCVGVKFHPANTKLAADSSIYVDLARQASQMYLPIFVHSFPRNTLDEPDSAAEY